MKYLIVGLGNIGVEYELTRHNIGFLVLDNLAEKFKSEFEVSRLASKSLIKHKGRTIHLIKPTTYMNLSGKSVNFWMQELKIEKSNILVVTDDIALPFTKLRLKPKGSDAGHNGLKNIEVATGGNNYSRLRFGVGDDFSKGRQVDYVLSRFTQSEFDELPQAIEKATDAILSFTTIGVERTMNFFN